ncbi:MAG TPA: hypothetical protein VH679_14040 [Vicinamibacterales bacterium]
MAKRWWWMATIVIGLATPAYAQMSSGVRAGVSGDPDQFYFGGHVETKPLIDRLTFRPNAEIGLGDGITLVTANIEFAYWIPIRNKPVSVYLGGGPALVIGDHNDDTDVGGGFNILVGVQHRKGLFAELKVGFNDSPDIKFGVGYAFK